MEPIRSNSSSYPAPLRLSTRRGGRLPLSGERLARAATKMRRACLQLAVAATVAQAVSLPKADTVATRAVQSSLQLQTSNDVDTDFLMVAAHDALSQETGFADRVYIHDVFVEVTPNRSVSPIARLASVPVVCFSVGCSTAWSCSLDNAHTQLLLSPLAQRRQRCHARDAPHVLRRPASLAAASRVQTSGRCLTSKLCTPCRAPLTARK